MVERYIWKRFLCPREGSINLSDRGFLADPDTALGRQLNPDLVSAADVSDIPCLVLLGEPGMGKSFVIEQAFDQALAETSEQGALCLRFDLRDYGSDAWLHQDVFEHAALKAWKEGSGLLYLFLDSLDECLLSVRNVASQLATELGRLPTTRLHLRLACRTAEWPQHLELALEGLWPSQKGVGVYELAPLRRVDVDAAAKAHGVDPTGFVTALVSTDATPFALKPVTLEFLLNLFSRGGDFPTSKKDLYLEGCRILCEDPSEARRRRGSEGSLSGNQRLALAARVAAITVFANRSAVWADVDRGNVPEADVTLRDLCGFTEYVDGLEFDATEGALMEVLGTGLFSSRGANRLGWAHLSYAEFLAAWYIKQRSMPWGQVTQLFTHAGDPSGTIPPQLYETCAWTAAFVPQIFAWILDLEPKVLLQSDVATFGADDRRALVDALLSRQDIAVSMVRDVEIRPRYKFLDHPGLPDQLRLCILDSTQDAIVRRAAIDIAAACHRTELAGILAGIALDANEPHVLRVQAAWAVCEIGEDASMASLRPLALAISDEDPDDELKGWGLSATWPQHMSGQELFSALTPPKQPNLIGAYYGFLSNEFVVNLQVSDLPEALRAIGGLSGAGWSESGLAETMVDQLLLLAWEHIDSPGVLTPFAQIALARLLAYRPLVSRDVREESFAVLVAHDETRRHSLALAMIELIGDSYRDAFWLVSGPTPVVLGSDLPWLIDQLARATSTSRRKSFASLIRHAMDLRNQAHIEAVFGAQQTSTELGEEVGWLFRPVDLGSKEAQESRDRHRKWKEVEAQRAEKAAASAGTYAEQARKLLRECEQGNLEAWWHLNLVMLADSENGHANEYKPDLRSSRFWSRADQGLRGRILSVAKRYLAERGADPDKWLGTKSIFRPAFAGYRAFRLLLGEEPAYLDSVLADVWQRWCPILLAYPAFGAEEEAVQKDLIARAYPHAVRQIVGPVKVLIEQEAQEPSGLSILRMLQGVRDHEVERMLVDQLRGIALQPATMRDLLDFLLERKVKEAREFAAAALTAPIPRGETEWRKALIAALGLLKHADDAGWGVIWEVVQGDTEFGEALFLAAAEESIWDPRHLVDKLQETEGADLFTWLENHFPHTEDPQPNGFHAVSPRESLAHWRDALLRALAGKGTYAACEAIRAIMDRFPSLRLDWLLQEALIAARRYTWRPPGPREILEITQRAEARLVLSGRQLLEVLIDSLTRLQDELQGETPSARDVWDKSASGFRPVDEPALSDYIKRFLERDLLQRGIIVNREVEIRRGTGGSPGERTDIHVDAVSKRSSARKFDRISAIIEVKGPWNPDLPEAMEAQLVKRYLADSQCRSGLYVVGWFDCEQWDDADSRKTQVSQLRLEEVMSLFDGQARQLSQGETCIRSYVLNAALR